MANKRKNNYSRKKEFKLDNNTLTLIIIGVLAIAFIIGYFIVGTLLSLVMIVGIGIILMIARILDKTRNKKKQRKIINRILIVVLFLMLVGIISVGGFAAYIVLTAPDFDINKLYLKESSIIYDKDGNEVLKLGSELRENIEYNDLPQVIVDALVATEDSRFFQHSGIDAPRFTKAVLGQLAGRSDAGGGSTLSMQVVKNSFTSSEASGIKGIIRKFTDIYMAVFKLEKNYTKEEIIEFYLNNHALGSNSYGIEQASQTYFGKSCSELNLSEASLLIGLYNAPTANNPFNHPEAATDRRATVLKLMVRHGYITQDEADAANAIPVSSLLASKSAATLAYQSYIDTVLDELESKYNIYAYKTPVLIYTNMDSSMQGKIDSIYNGTSNSFTWENDVVQSGAAVIEVDTGKIVAIAGGRNKTTERSYNYATQIKRQIGSTAKPLFDYGPGMEYNNWSTYTQFVDEAWSYTNGPSVNNSDGKFMGQISLRTALSQSRNIPALKAFQSVDNKKILSFVESLGITPEESNGYLHEAHSLGSFNGSNPLEMAAAYAAFANGGYYIEPLTVNKVVFRDTGEAQTFESEKTKVMSDSTAYMITDVLVTAVNSGLSSGAKVNNVTVAAKTGTSSYTDEIKKKYNMSSNAINDAWIVGYDPDYAIGMWYGYDQLSSKYYSTTTSSVVQRGRLYRALGNAVFTKNNQKFTVPSSVVRVGVEVGSDPALLPSDNTPEDQITYEYFKKGTQPTEVSTKYQKLTSVSNLNVTYSEKDVKTTITWSKLNTPSANESYGDFGYKVYLNDTYLGFTTENTYTIDRPTTISGTYKVVTSFEEFSGNESDPTTFTFNYGSTSTDENINTANNDKYQIDFNSYKAEIAVNSVYTDPSTPLEFSEDGTPKTNSINLNIITSATVTGPDNKVVKTFSNGEKVTFTATQNGTYKILYKFKYNGITFTRTKAITAK